MFRTLDRYVIRQTIVPFLVALVLLTFVLLIQPIIDRGETLIAKGASFGVAGHLLLTLVPQALGISLPMSLLLGLLVALGRLSTDREVVALQACGVSLGRLLRPVGLVAGLVASVTLYVNVVGVPAGNRAFQQLSLQVIGTWTQGQIRPHVFFRDFPGLVLYVGDEATEGGWKDVFAADTSDSGADRLYTAARGEIRIDAAARTVQMVLHDGWYHFLDPQRPDRAEVTGFVRTVLSLDPSQVFPSDVINGPTEQTIAELRTNAASLDAERAACVSKGEQPADTCARAYSSHNHVIAIHNKFAIPVACLVFAVMALPLGVTTRRDGKMASFVLGAGVVYTYYFVMSIGGSLAKGHQLPPPLAAWLANLVLGSVAIALFLRRARGVERSIRITLPFGRRTETAAATPVAPVRPHVASSSTSGNGRVVLVIRVPDISLPGPTLLDRYVMRTCARAVLLAGGILLGLFYVATFIDLSDKLFKGQTTGGTILTLLWFSTPQYLYFIIPIAVLIGTLVTIGAITKNSELVVMKACGISLYRIAAPLLSLALVASGGLFLLEERVLAHANRRADDLNNIVRGRNPRSADALNRRWLVGRDGRIYHYVYFDRDRNELHSVSAYRFDEGSRELKEVTFAAKATYSGPASAPADADERLPWEGHNGWVRRLQPRSERFELTRFETRPLTFESPQYFSGEEPDAELMSYSDLRAYVVALEAGGFNVVPYVVSLHRKIAFPFVTLVMTLIAVPFAVTTGKRGALYGIGAGIVLALVYWVAISSFGAIGSAGLVNPLLAAWAPNILFGTMALYLVLTVRT